MESVSLFPKIHLELCDMQCKDNDLVIETSVTLKVRSSVLLSQLNSTEQNYIFHSDETH